MHNFSSTAVCLSTFNEGEKIKLVGRNGDMEKWRSGGGALSRSTTETWRNERETRNQEIHCGYESIFSRAGIYLLESWNLLSRGVWRCFVTNVLGTGSGRPCMRRGNRSPGGGAINAWLTRGRGAGLQQRAAGDFSFRSTSRGRIQGIDRCSNWKRPGELRHV